LSRSFGLAVRRWRQFLANRGARATAQALFAGVTRRLFKADGTPPASELWRNADAAPDAPHPFDAEFGAETSGLIWGEHLATGHPHDAWNTAYYGIAPSAFRQGLQILRESAGLDWRQCTFIDLGSGKGRAVLLAREHSFARVVGVELSPELHAVAIANVSRAGGAGIQLIRGDAAEFPWEQAFTGTLLFFLYNPFSRPVLEKFLRRLHASQYGGDVYLLYVNPELDGLLMRQPWMEKLWQQTISIGDADRLADRFGSSTETVAAYRCRPQL